MHDIDRALFEFESESQYEGERDELELATELLEVSSEAELDRFIGDLLSTAVDVGKTFLKSDTGRAVTGVVRKAARKALPQIGQAVGNYVAPGVGGQLGQQAGSWLGGALGLELEGMSHEDRELEAAKAFVRFAQTAASEAARMPRSVPPPAAARRAVIVAAQRHLPGLIPQLRQIAVGRAARPPVPSPSPAPAPGPTTGQDREWELGEYEGEYESEGEYELEAELAQELLEVAGEAELDQFIGKLISGVTKFAKSGAGKALGGVLKGVAKTALPMVGSALGTFVMPGVGTAIGGQLGSMASKLLEVGEAETMGEAEAEFEAALRFVRIGRDAARLVGRAPRNVAPRTAARAATIAAARRHAPSLLRSSGPRGWQDRRGSRLGSRDPRTYRRPAGRRPIRWQWGPAYLGPAAWANDGASGDDWAADAADSWDGVEPNLIGSGDQDDQSGFEFE